MVHNSLLYRNLPQIRSMLVRANKEYHVLGRGTGKTSRILAQRSVENIFSMPRLSGLNIGSTYSMQLTRTLPSLLAGWADLGYYRDVHYTIGTRPNKRYRWIEPYEAPVKYEYYIQWLNGSGMHLGSQDVSGSTIGLNIQWLQGDEAKKLNIEQLDEETRPAMRGYKHLFGHLPNYRSECYTTSMPLKASEKWILSELDKMDPELIRDIILIELEINKLKHALLSCSAATGKVYTSKIRQYEALADQLRMHAVYYQEASSLENYAVLGKEYFDDLYRNLPPLIFDIEILNLRNTTVEGGFYPTFNVNYHTYPGSFNNTYLESLNYNLELISKIDCRQDADLVGSEPLHIAIDWGAHMNYMSIAQHVGRNYRILNELYVKHPEHIDHLAIKFAEYYRHHHNKDVYFNQDVTGDNKKDNSNQTAAEQFMSKVKELCPAFNFIRRKRAAAPTHEHNYKLAYKVLASRIYSAIPFVSINYDKCPHLVNSICNAPLEKDARKGIRKDKSSEKKPHQIDPLNATHPSDTFDIHLNHLCYHLIDDVPGYVPNLM